LLGKTGSALRVEGGVVLGLGRFGLYHSLFEWYHPLYLKDKDNNWNSQVRMGRIPWYA
jgi:hypothetical protein